MMDIRDAGFGADFDIFWVGSRRDKMRLDSTMDVFGKGNKGEEGVKVRLKVMARSRTSSRCCVWSSPTGTLVALLCELEYILNTEPAAHLKSKTSAAWSTGYASRPRRRSDSDTSSSEFEFRETAILDFQVVIRRKCPTGVRVLRYQASSACSGT